MTARPTGGRVETGGVPERSRWGRPVAAGYRGPGRPAPSGLPTRKKPFCKGKKKDGSNCGARKAKGTDYCAGHLRQRGEL